MWVNTVPAITSGAHFLDGRSCGFVNDRWLQFAGLHLDEGVRVEGWKRFFIPMTDEEPSPIGTRPSRTDLNYGE